MRPKLYEKRLEVCLTPRQYELLKKYAKCDEVTINAFVRKLISDFLGVTK